MRACVGLGLALAVPAAWAQVPPPDQAADEGTLAPVTVSADRQLLPVDGFGFTRGGVLGGRLREASLGQQVSEALAGVPGVIALERHNAAQDLQVSIRGFGARASFGVRGLRLYEDGIPLTQPDGQGQTGTLDTWRAQRVEVLTGPWSVLQGNASGGVIQVVNPEPAASPEAVLGLVWGADNSGAVQTEVSGRMGSVGASVRSIESASGGFRRHGRSQRSSHRARLVWELGGGDRFGLTLKHVRAPEVQDPLGLTEAQWRADPRQSGSGAQAYQSRKSVEQSQLGLQHRITRGAHTWQWLVHAGHRAVTQFQAIPAPPESTVQELATHPGGVIDLARAFRGADLRWQWQGSWAGLPARLTLGGTVEELSEQRRGSQNFILGDAGQAPTLGVRGALRRDELNRVTSADPHLHLHVDLSSAWQLQVGVRRSRVDITSRDRYIVPGNGDDSGARSWQATTPVAGVRWQAAEGWRLHASAGRSFESPTLNEVAYRSVSGGSTGLNTALNATTGEQIELGSQWSWARGGRLDLTLFQIRTRDELAVAVNSFGRSTFQNVGGTRRSGLELGGETALWPTWAPGWRGRLGLTVNRATYTDAFSSTAAGVSNTVPSGRDVPGVPSHLIHAELSWRARASGWHAALAWHGQGRIWANDLNEAQAPSSSRWAARLGWQGAWASGWRLDALLKVENLLDAHSVGSVIVNEGNRRYFEPAPARTLGVSVNMVRRF